MVKKQIIYLVLVFLLVPVVQAQDTVSIKTWHIETGYQNFRIYDKNTSPLIYVANNGYLGFLMQKEKQKKTWSLHASVSIGSNQSKRFGQRKITTINEYDIFGESDSIEYIINPLLSFVSTNLNYSYRRNLNQTLRLGAELNENFYYGALGADVWFFNQLSLSPAIEKNWIKSSKHEIQSLLSFPVMSYLVRQPYTLDPSLPIPNYFLMYLKTGSSLASVNKFQQINITINYGYHLNEKKKVGLAYKFMWLNNSGIDDRNLRSYSNTLCLTYSF